MKIDPLFALLRRRGVLWPSAEIYGGLQGLYDYGPLGTTLKRRLEEAWARWFLGRSEDYYRIEPAEVVPEAVVRASGHLEHFTDPEVSCANCGTSSRAETVLERWRPNGIDGLSAEQIGELLKRHHAKCPSCGSEALSIPRPFNMMFAVPLGVAGTERGYLRPETAQGSYVSFARMWDVGRRTLPLGIGVIGRAYRNEIAPRQILFRMRAFTQAELQIFFEPGSFPVPMGEVAEEHLPVLRSEARERGEEAATSVSARDLAGDGALPDFYVYHLVQSYRFLRDVLKHPVEAIRLLEKSEAERAFYNRIQFDIELRQESLGGFREVAAVHYRGDYDLARHAEASHRDLGVLTESGARVVPHVLELTFGVDRNLWALADLGIGTEDGRTVWRLPPYLAPISVGVFPLLKKEHTPTAREVARQLRVQGFTVEYDDSGSIGRRYARIDEVGAPFAVTVDGETVDPNSADHGTVTLRHRDSKAQERVPIDELGARIRPALELPFPPTPSGP